MDIKIAIISLLVCSCGPSWKDVKRHPDGTYEDMRTHECWTEYNEPVPCPSKTEKTSGSLGPWL